MPHTLTLRLSALILSDTEQDSIFAGGVRDRPMRSEIIRNVKRVVVKIGTASLCDKSGSLDERRVERLAGQVHALRQRGLQVAVVSSGAIGAGMNELGLTKRPTRLPQLQACAAVGQGRLVSVYDRCFRQWGYHAAQMLLTREDIDDRKRYLNASNAIHAVLAYGGVPLINENDTIAVEEITFGDNDGLAALVTHLLQAQLMILLSVVDGLYENPDAPQRERRVIPEVPAVTDEIIALAAEEMSQGGRGGMASKLEAARSATLAGEAALIANADAPRVLERIFDGEPVGTLFLPNTRRMRSRKRWLRFGSRPRGTIHVDAGARDALAKRGKSLLPSGVTAVSGAFNRGDLVAVCDGEGREFARGLTNYAADEIAAIRGRRSSDINRLLGEAPYQEVIHRDHLVLND